MKQLMRLALLRCRTAASCQATLLAWLIAWALQEHEMQAVRQVLAPLGQDLQAALAQGPGSNPPEAVVPAPLSSWRVAALGVQTLRGLVQGSWTLSRLQQCLPDLQRFLRDSPRKRRQQEQTIRTMLVLLLGADFPLDGFFFNCSGA